jgi:cytochrome c
MPSVTTHEDVAPPALPSPSVAGAGLRDHAGHDPVSPRAASIGGLVALVLGVGVAVVLWTMNPAVMTGQAGGTANQLGAAPAAGGGATPDQGKQIIQQQPCGTCHVIPGVSGATGTVGPSLAGVAGRSTIAGGAVPNTGPADLERWIENPPAVKPGTAMPNYNLTPDQAAAIVAYLETLK